MSIPPLVCSTPPPPDQCEDDKDTEDYDLQYSLSQEDDDDYNFGNFSTYNHCESPTLEKQAAKEINTEETNEKCESNITKNETTVEPDTQENILDTNNRVEEKLKYDEDINIEDLNLKVDDESIDTNLKDNNIQINIEDLNLKVDDESIDTNLKDNNVQINIEDLNLKVDDESIDTNLKDNKIQIKLSSLETVDTPLTENSMADISSVINNLDDDDNLCLTTSPCKENTTEIEEHITESEFFVEEVIETQLTKTISDSIEIPPTPLETADNSDFGDFDDFQFIRSDSKVTEVIESCENPWESEVIDDSDFGDFTANFEDNKNETGKGPTNMDAIIIKESNDQPSDNLDGSDFGDFDNFQSSAVETEIKIAQEPETAHSAHVLNIQTGDDEPLVMENINKLLSSIFDKEIIETDNEDEVKLESLLTETWGYLLETDVRQPYIVNWNNSLGQKTLLRALCIDSRNILFGPKWGHNMPKYAANLSIAPLQPQKQLSQSGVILRNDAVNVEKPVSKCETWTDPFTAEGQESCNIEGESNVVEPRPTDIDVFESTMSSKLEKIYPNSLDIQPIRQINLPETHIFTPTDSETPRSKTTLYNCGPPVILPPQISGTQHIESENNPSDFVKEEKKTEEEEEDWEFQGFKSSPIENSLTHNSNSGTVEPTIDKSNKTPTLPLPIQTTTYQTQVLEPIKIEPIMPTLNWPDPGEVKHVFEDFTDFISSSLCNEKSSTILPNVNITATNTKGEITEANTEDAKNDTTEASNDGSCIDDEFNTFQSALPPNQQLAALKSANISSNNTITSSQANTLNHLTLAAPVKDFEHILQKVNNIKSDSISFTNNIPKFNEPLVTNFASTSTITELPVENKGFPTQSNILQPTPANTNVSLTPNQQKGGQILQPLSLESYSQINWPSPGIDLQDLSRFNPVNTLHSLKNDLSTNCQNRNSPIHNSKNITNNQTVADDDVWGEFVSSKPKQQTSQINKNQIFNDDDEWTDFVSSSSINPQNGLNTISFNVHTNSNMHHKNKTNFTMKTDQLPLDIPTLNYITPKTNNSHKTYNDRHFQNL